MTVFRVALLAVLLGCDCGWEVLSGTVGAQEISISRPQRTETISFRDEILPILQRNCVACHNGSDRQGDLVLESPEAILAGGDSGPAMVPGKSEESLLISLASHRAEPVMPPKGNDVAAKNLSSVELGLIALWIDQGAPSVPGSLVLSPKKWTALPPGLHPAHAVTLSPDGEFLACSRANQIHLYHVPTGQLVAQLSDPALAAAGIGEGVAHADVIQSLVFDDRGDLLASGGFREVKIWRRPTDVHQVVQANQGPLTACGVDRLGKRIAIAGADGVIRVIDAATGQITGSLQGHTAAVTALEFEAEGRILASSSQDGTLRFWSIAQSLELAKIESVSPVSDLCWIRSVAEQPVAEGTPEVPLPADDAAYLSSLAEQWWIVSGGDDNEVRVWSLPKGEASVALAGVAAPLSQRPVRSGRWLAFVTSDNKIGVFDLQQGVAVGVWSAGATPPTGLAMVAAPDLMAKEAEVAGAPPVAAPSIWLCDAQGFVSEHDAATGSVLTRWQASRVPIKSLAVSSDKAWLVTGDAEGRSVVWNLSPSMTESISAVDPAAAIQGSVMRSPDGRFAAFVSGAERRSVWVMPVDGSAEARGLAPAEAPISAIAFSLDGGRIAIGSDDGRIWFAPVDGSMPWQPLGQQAGRISSLSFDATGARLYAAGSGISAWTLETKESVELAAADSAVMALGIGADGQPFGITVGGKVRVWNAADGAVLRDFGNGGETLGWGLLGDRSILALATRDQPLRLWRMADGQVDKEFASPPLARVIVSTADRARLAMLDDAGVVSWLDPATSRWTESTGVAGIRSIAFAADGSLRWLADDRKSRVLAPKYTRDLFDENGEIVEVRCSPVGLVAFTAASDGSLRGFQLPQGNAVFATTHGEAIVTMAVSNDAQKLVTAGASGSLRFWASNGNALGIQQVAGLAGGITSVGFVDDAQSVAYRLQTPPAIRVIDVTDGKPREGRSDTDASPRMSVISESGVLSLAAGSMSQWSPSLRRRVAGHTQPLTAVAALPGQMRHVVSASRDGTARRWNLDNGQQVTAFNHGGALMDLAVRFDGERIATVSDDKTARLWNINGQQIAQTTGSIRRQAEAVRTTQRLTSAQARVTRAKQLLDTAEKDVPVKTEADRVASEALAAANKRVADQQAVVETTRVAKETAEAEALRTAMVAQEALAAQTMGERLIAEANARIQSAQQRATQIAAVAMLTPSDARLAQRLTEAQARVTAMQAEVQRLTQELEAAKSKATAAATAADAAATQATQAQKPYNDALDALKLAEAAQNLASQQQAVAAVELTRANELPATRRAAVAQFEAQVVEAQARADAAKVAATEAISALDCVRFSPDGKYWMTGGQYLDVQAWDAEKGTPIAAFAGHTAAVTEVAFVSDGHFLSVSADGSLRLWTVRPEWRLERTLGGVEDVTTLVDRVTALDFDSESRRLVAGSGVPSRGGDLVTFDVATGQVVSRIAGAHEDVVYSVAFSPDDRLLASAGADRYVRTFDLAQGTQLRRFEGHTNYVLGVAWQGDGSMLASAGADATVKVWDADTADQLRTIENFGKHVTGALFIGDTTQVLTSCGDRRLRIHDANSGGAVRNFPEWNIWLHAAASTRDGAIVAAGAADGSVGVWNGTNGQQLWRFEIKAAAEEPQP